MKIPIRNKLISIFVIVWLCVFFYESTCVYYLQPIFKCELPRLKFLFPPAGWIMFYNVGDSFGFAEVYGIHGGNNPQLIDPHEILETRAIGYDNINRNVLSAVLSPGMSDSFCPFLKRKFPYFQKFLVTYVEYPHLTQQPFEKKQTIVYGCGN